MFSSVAASALTYRVKEHPLGACNAVLGCVVITAAGSELATVHHQNMLLSAELARFSLSCSRPEPRWQSTKP